ncbi:MAG: squalene--hopene cyclase [Pirellulales bacterium]|nr:squalene--hopene cyclase [Pirellulales bacterium]
MAPFAPIRGLGLVPCLASISGAYWLLWAGSLVLSVVLVTLLWTRWGHSKPLHKCAVLSLLAHLILAFLAMTVRIVSGDGGGGGGGGPPIRVRIVAETSPPSVSPEEDKPAPITELEPPKLLAKQESPQPLPMPEPTPQPVRPTEEPTEEPAPNAVPTTNQPPTLVAETKTTPTTKPEEIENTETQPPPPDVATPQPEPIDRAPTVAEEPLPIEPMPPVAEVPANAYALRSEPGRLGFVAGQGGNADTEAAVEAALRWLAAAQSPDGRWDANRFGAGRDEMVLGQNRGNAGRGADTGITALAVLAFLGAGHSHAQGAYQENVKRGLDFLLRSQSANGSLFGNATLYAQMYCHSMSTFALAEAQAVTGDRRLEEAVARAVAFSLASQNTSTGGWRYHPGDTGDTSQLGWQVMALASAERAGVPVPPHTWQRINRFLRSVERGNSGGLASYRPDSPASTSMTAEALYCRIVLEDSSGVRLQDQPANEATTQLLASLPRAEQVNLYYWYYATLALHHRQRADGSAAAAWRTWNDAMVAALTKTQVAEGEHAGSWEQNTLWGGYGGRIYTTAMATMCLEVYYRYALPPEQPTWSAARPGTAPPR